jgi:competence protein ComEC
LRRLETPFGLRAALLCGVLAGSALQLVQERLWAGHWYGGLACGAALLLAACRRMRRLPASRAILLFAAAALLMFSVCGLRATSFSRHALDPRLEGRDVLLTGVVGAMPQISAMGSRFRFEVESATEAGRTVAVPPLVELGWWNADSFENPGSGSAPELRAGERWSLVARLKAPHGSRNPHGFDYELWAWEQGVQAVGSVRLSRESPAPRRLEDGFGRHPVERLRQSVRDAVMARLAGAGTASDTTDISRRRSAAGVVAALVTGDQRAISQTDWDVFRATGVAHLMSISGLHVTMFAWLAAAVVGWSWRRSARLCLRCPAQNAAVLGGVLLAAFYAAFSGGGLPSQRTVLMLAIVAALRLSGRRWPWPQVWLLACAAAVAFDPWALLQAGFWLSFVAVGVLFASDPSPVSTQAGTGWRYLPGRFATLLREQVVVTLALAPLALLLFGQVSLVGLPANLLAVPWTTLVVTPLALLGVFFHPFWDLAAWAVSALEWPLRALAALPNAALALPAAPIWVAAGAVGGGAWLCMSLPPGLRLLGLAPVLPALMWFSPAPAIGSFELTALDVGQGSAVLVRTARHALLYDTGPAYGSDSDAGQRTLVPLLQSLGVRLDTVVLSHRDNDHAGGARAVLTQQPQAALLSSIEADHPLQALRPVTRCVAGQHWQWDGVDFSVVWPQPAGYRPGTSSNALSCVLRIEAGGRSALLTGDIGLAEESALVQSGVDIGVDWLLVPHHGSGGSSGAGFLAAVSPRVVFAQTGYRNRFGHPAPAALARYADQGIPWLDSVHCGAAVWNSRQPATNVCERVREPHYWQHNVP